MKTRPVHHQPKPDLTDIQIDELIAHPYWEKLEGSIERLIEMLPPTAEKFERTTVLTWIYQQQGVMTFLELADRIAVSEGVSARKKYTRTGLRGLQRLLLVAIDNFPDEKTPVDAVKEEEIGRGSMVSLTWTGMVWLRRAWQARARLAVPASAMRIHRMLVEEEDDGKANEPYWVENISGADPEGPTRRARRIMEVVPAANSIFSSQPARARRRA
jgi:hypothetical protein